MSQGDPEAAQRRLAMVSGLPLLDVTTEAQASARHLVGILRLPARAQADALHLAIAASHGVAYLLTWNSAHIANAELRPLAEDACRAWGYMPPVLCTPDELMGGLTHE